MRHATIQCNVEHATANRRACTAQHAPCRPERPTRMHHFSTTHSPEHTACAHCAFPRQLPCAIKVLCDTYTYVAAVWSVCSATCGAGVRTREVGCQARCRLLYRPPWTRARAWLNGSAPLRALRSIAIRWNLRAHGHARACVPTAPPPGPHALVSVCLSRCLRWRYVSRVRIRARARVRRCSLCVREGWVGGMKPGVVSSTQQYPMPQDSKGKLVPELECLRQTAIAVPPLS